MKPSKYNFFFDNGEWQYWFNALNVSYFQISKRTGDKLKVLLKEPEAIEKISKNLFSQLKDKGFVISDDCDELQIIRDGFNEAIHRKNYSLTVLPTLNCNFKCWYCIQDHIPSIMDESTIEKIKLHIRYMIFEEKIDSLDLNWFGGEPLMFFKQIVAPISKYAKDLCNEMEVPFSLSVTSNGYFIDTETSKCLTELGFTSYQITLDGDCKNHDKVKFQKGCDSTFKHVLRNINKLLSTSSDIVVYLRINYTGDNVTEDIVNQVCEFIENSYREQVIISPHKVWQEKPDPKVRIVINKVLDGFAKEGFLVERWNPSLGFIPCYASREYFNTINYNGNVLKCTACNDLYADTPHGVISDSGAIEWKDSFDKKYQEPAFENEGCLNCKGLPICMGQCPRNNINGYLTCKYADSDDTLEESIFEFLSHEFNDKKKG